jgi:putative ABC transport system permease protein
MMEALRQVQFSLRALRKASAFSSVTIATLGLGIAANAVTFSLLKAVLFNPLPYADPDRLTTLVESDPHAPYPETISAATFASVRRANHSFERVSLWGDAAIRPIDAMPGDMIRGMRVSANFFGTLGVPMYLGRGFDPDEELEGRSRVVVLAYGTWRDRFGGDQHIIGRAIPTVDGRYTVVGVTPADFVPLHMSNPAEFPRLFIPLGFDVDHSVCRGPTCRGFRAVGRLQSSASVKQANNDLDSIAQRLRATYPADYPAGATIRVTSLWEHLVGRFGSTLWMLQAAALLLLGLACANVATLLIARLTARRTELGVRASLGATRGRLLCELSVENAIIAIVAAIVGTCGAWATTRVIARFAEPNLPRLAQLTPDWWMLAFAIGASMSTMLVFGVVPASATFRRVFDTLRVGSRMTASRAEVRRLRYLVVGEIASAFVLIATVGLLSNSYANLTQVNPGYEPQGVLTLSLLPEIATSHLAYFDAVASQVRTAPGVEDAAYASTLPLSHPATSLLFVRERPVVNDAEAPNLNTYLVSTNYLDVMRIPVTRGRGFNTGDTESSPRVAVISDSAARIHFTGDPVGQHIKLQLHGDDAPWATVVGVVNDVLQYGLDTKPDAAVYVPFSQFQMQGYASLVVRSRIPVPRVESAVRAAMLAVDPNQPVFHVQPMSEYIALSIAQRTFALTLVAAFGFIALVLATAGVFGVACYIVEQRRRDVAVRLALGATAGHLVSRITGEVVGLAVIGMACGAVFMAASTKAVSGLLFEVSTLDIRAHAAAAFLLAIGTVLAALPAVWRITRIDPAVALRTD